MGPARPAPKRPSRPLRVLTLASRLVRLAPLSWLTVAADRLAGPIAVRLMVDKATMLDRHLARVHGWQDAGLDDAGPDDAGDPDIEVSSRAGLGSYARYWVESFRLPNLDPTTIDRGFSFIGFEKLQAIRASGRGPILVLPHLGGWEWAAAWLSAIASVPVAAVVERLEPDDVFDWFVKLRSSIGINVIPLGSDALVDVLAAVNRGDIVCLLSDRDIGGSGREVPFFGEATSLPVGPVVLSRRTGSPLVPTTVFFDGRRRICQVGDPIDPADHSVRQLHQVMAASLETMIAQAPEQWHLLEPNWPSDMAG